MSTAAVVVRRRVAGEVVIGMDSERIVPPQGDGVTIYTALISREKSFAGSASTGDLSAESFAGGLTGDAERHADLTP